MEFNLEALNQTRKRHDQMTIGLLLMLMILIFINWKFGLNMIYESKQLKNDIEEQVKIIEMEGKNLEALERLSSNQKKLLLDMKKVKIALPCQDEKLEEVISMFEDMALKDEMVIEGIAARVVPETQISHDLLMDSVDVIEYSFSVESYLPNILSFIRAIRSSYRLMDVMAMEIEKKEGGVYRVGFIINLYHLKSHSND